MGTSILGTQAAPAEATEGSTAALMVAATAEGLEAPTEAGADRGKRFGAHSKRQS
tara:strand:+ start:297 stop:461 length:165 start_codon:yes stop_codon:yes gene_type:complete